MRDTTKGLLAAGTGLVLLLGGAGTLASWTETDVVDGTDLTAGRLDLTPVSCTDWTLDDLVGSLPLLSTTRLVPGDQLTRTCTYTITAIGDHLEATLDLTDPTFSGPNADFAGALTASVAATVGGLPVTTLDPGDDGSTLTATITVDWDATDVAHEGLQAVLDDLTVTATQTHA